LEDGPPGGLEVPWKDAKTLSASWPSVEISLDHECSALPFRTAKPVGSPSDESPEPLIVR